jgi:regulator of cell morphogenesis and NO signaling
MEDAMNTTTLSLDQRTVGELAVEMPNSIRIFEAWKIDYCCGGRTPLADACAVAGKTVGEFLSAIEASAKVPDAIEQWPARSLTQIASDIVSTYHTYTREELQTLLPLSEKVHGVHGARRRELSEVVRLVKTLIDDLLPHMMKEEQILFPYVTELEQGNAPMCFFGTVKNPIRMMMLEHDRVGEILAELRSVSGEYKAPEDACFSYRELYRRLSEFESRTHEHIHIENNLYFPRAVELEEGHAG